MQTCCKTFLFTSLQISHCDHESHHSVGLVLKPSCLPPLISMLRQRACPLHCFFLPASVRAPSRFQGRFPRSACTSMIIWCHQTLEWPEHMPLMRMPMVSIKYSSVQNAGLQLCLCAQTESLLGFRSAELRSALTFSQQK